MPRLKEPNDRQIEILKFVRTYTDEHKYAPNLDEIGEAVGVSNRSSIRASLASLVERGHMLKAPWYTRNYYVTPAGCVAIGEREEFVNH
jgi:SOS-response transcriptional repressor LexA